MPPINLNGSLPTLPGPYVIAMTSEWGSGKTFFLKAWGKDLLARKRPCVYFNAWETDHAGDPLLALTGCITHSLRKQKLIKPKRLKNFATAASKIVSQAPSTFSKILVGVANHYTDGGLEDVKEVVSDTMKLGTDLFLKNNARRKGFTKQLEAIAKEASDNTFELPEDPINETKHFPLFVMIDELDRCRPSYVIELLENIKHLFGVPGVIFLLAIDQDQILGVIQHTFGLSDTNGRDIRQNYLRKFIDVFWKLPNPDAFTYAFNTIKTKGFPIANDWPCQPALYWGEHISDENRTFFEGKNLFYAMLALFVQGNESISLRELTQHIDKYNLISLAYPLSTKESFVIFNLITAPLSKHSDIKNSLNYANGALRIIQINTSGGRLVNSVFGYLHGHIFGYRDPELKDPRERSSRDEILYDFIRSLVRPFSGPELYASAMKKLSFLDEFDFGDVPQTDSAMGELMQHVAMPARPHQDQADH